MSHAENANAHIEMARMIAQSAAEAGRTEQTGTVRAQAATAFAIAGLAEAVLHLANQAAAREN